MRSSLPRAHAWMTSRALLAVAAFFFTVGAALSAPGYRSILGDWQSNYGPVHLDFVSAERPDGSASVKGHWTEPPGDHRGVIEEGHYDARTGELSLVYLETWSKHRGRIRLKLDKSGKSLAGTFKSDDGATGTWTWKRK